jgi:ribonuclease T1
LRLFVVLLLVIWATAAIAGCAGSPAADAQPQATADQGARSGSATRVRTPVTAKPTAAIQPARSGLPTIRYQDLPNEAKETIALIEQDGPFPFERDGITFQNRERILPRQVSGYYREYTVITPGARDRGARRIVAGAEGEFYYTDDHYESFREVTP